MFAGLKVLSILIVLGLAVYFGLDSWQATVNVYASSCETQSGRQLPMSVCKYIVNYRYQKGD